MKRLSLVQWSRLGVTIQLVALLRTLVEYFRMKLAMGDAMKMTDADPLVLTALVATILLALGVSAHFLRRYRFVLALAALTVIAVVMMDLALRG